MPDAPAASSQQATPVLPLLLSGFLNSWSFALFGVSFPTLSEWLSAMWSRWSIES